MFWLVLLLYVATTVIGELLKPKTQKPAAGGLGDFDYPTAQEGRAIPVVYGTVKIKGGNTVWWGDLKVVPIKQSASIISFSSTLVGFRYFIGVQYALCWGVVDELIQINADKKSVAYTDAIQYNGNGSEDYHQLTCTAATLFGGINLYGGQGGFTGIIDFYRGLQTQQPNAYLTSKQGRILTPFTGLAYTYTGVGNGTLTDMSGGAFAKAETITITAIGIDANAEHSTFQKMKFQVTGSVSGNITASAANPDGSYACWADQAFSSAEFNATVTTGSTQYGIGDAFTFTTLHSHLAPSYKKICYAVLEGCYIGTQNYPKEMEYIIRRTPDPFLQGPGVSNLAGDANGALAIYDFMTDPDFGLGILPAKFNAATWQAVAATLAAEGLGVAVQFDTPDAADTLVADILRHIDGVVYSDPQTALWEIKLARADYVVADLVTLDTSAIVGKVDYQRGSWQETTNHIVLSYVDKNSDFNVRSVQAYDPANIAVTQEVRSESVDYKSLSNSATAQQVLARVLSTFAFPLGKLKVEVNRNAWNFRMGGVFIFTWLPLGIAGMIFRVTHIGYGEVRSGKITIDAVEDIFGVADAAFISPPVSGWINPAGAPPAPALQTLLELPYHLMVLLGLEAGIWEMALAVRGDQICTSFQIWLSVGTYEESEPLAQFVPGATLNAAYPIGTLATDTVGFTVTGTVDETVLPTGGTAAQLDAGSFLALIDEEIIAYQGYVDNGDGTLTFSPAIRGVFDTVPAAHAAGAPVFFFDGGAPLTKAVPEAVDLSFHAKLLPSNGSLTFPIATASELALVTNSRFARPYPPGNLLIQGGAWGVVPNPAAGDLFFSWVGRNRLTQTPTGLVVAQDAPNIPSEGTSWLVVVKVGGVVMHSDVSYFPSYAFTAAQRALDNPDMTQLVEIDLYTLNAAGLQSFYPQTFQTVMSGAVGPVAPAPPPPLLPPPVVPAGPTGNYQFSTKWTFANVPGTIANPNNVTDGNPAMFAGFAAPSGATSGYSQAQAQYRNPMNGAFTKGPAAPASITFRCTYEITISDLISATQNSAADAYALALTNGNSTTMPQVMLYLANAAGGFDWYYTQITDQGPVVKVTVDTSLPTSTDISGLQFGVFVDSKADATAGSCVVNVYEAYFIIA